LLPFQNLEKQFRGSRQGRRRKCFLKAKNMRDFFRDTLAREWVLYLESISSRERDIGVVNKGRKFVWLQLFKDIRKLYRLVFRTRFHRCDKRRDANQGAIVNSILGELGLDSGCYNTFEIFSFFYPVLAKLRRNPTFQEEVKTFSKVFDANTRENREEFMSHPQSQLFV